MIQAKDFEGADGKIDWAAYRRARVQAGEECTRCSGYVLYPKGQPDMCSDCRDLQEHRGEVQHDSRIRCPKCGHVEGDELPGTEGEHNVSCNECGHDYTIGVLVWWTYVSPPMEDAP